MLHAGMAAAFAHRFVQHVVRRGGAEGCDIAGAKQPDRVRGELEFRHRHQLERAQLAGGALRLRIEAADRFQRVAEKIEPHRLGHAGREQIDDAAAHGVIAGFAHGRGAIKAVEIEPLGDAGHRQDIARRCRQRLPGQKLTRRHALQHGVDGGQQDGGMLAAFNAGKARQRHHALRHHRGMRRDAIVRQTIPGREFQNFDVGREKAERARQHRQARTVAADHCDRDRRRLFARSDRAGEIGNDQSLRAIGNTGERQRPAGRKPLRRRLCQRRRMGRH